jgi:hypothetical protein
MFRYIFTFTFLTFSEKLVFQNANKPASVSETKTAIEPLETTTKKESSVGDKIRQRQTVPVIRLTIVLTGDDQVETGNHGASGNRHVNGNHTNLH